MRMQAPRSCHFNMGPVGQKWGTILLLFWLHTGLICARQSGVPLVQQSSIKQYGDGSQSNTWILQHFFGDVLLSKNVDRVGKRTEGYEIIGSNGGLNKLPQTNLKWGPKPLMTAVKQIPMLEHTSRIHKRAVEAVKKLPVADHANLTEIHADYKLILAVAPQNELSESDRADLQSYLSHTLTLPKHNVHIIPSQSQANLWQLYFSRLHTNTSSRETQDLIPAKLIRAHLNFRQMQNQFPNLGIQNLYTNESWVDHIELDAMDFFHKPYFPYVVTAAAVLLLAVIILVVWCCLQQKNRKNASLAGGYGTTTSAGGIQQQICLYPSAKPSVNNATMIQPDISQIVTNKACGGCGTPVHGSPFSGSGMGSPVFSGSSSNSGTPNPGTPTLTGSGTPINTPPLRLKKGLLERRGSNASLTIDLGSSMSDSPTMGSPPRESTAEEYLLSAGNRLSRKQLRNCLKNVNGLYEEFWEIPMNHPDKIEVAGSGMKNRYRTIIPNEATRVKLPETDGDLLSGYMNANYIRGYGAERKAYIATQGPMSNTIFDFWRVIWQEKAPIIVMITKLKEKNRIKCEGYLPEKYGTYGNVEIFVHGMAEREGYQVRPLTIKYLNEEHHVLHYWYTAWPDHKAPDTARTLLELVKEVEQQRTCPTSNPHQGPVVVHCSAGIGRTGCFIATSIGTRQLREEHMVDVLGTVCAMRLDRGGMVQTNEQYEFVHHTLCLYEKELPEHPPSDG